MTLTIELTAEQARKLQQKAARAGLDAVEYLRRLIDEEPPTVEDPTLALLAAWRAEDATDDPKEIAAAEQELEEFKQAINANRAATGERPVYP